MYGHILDRCFKVAGYPKDKGKKMVSYTQNVDLPGNDIAAGIESSNSPIFLKN